jgi:hypothetical protein
MVEITPTGLISPPFRIERRNNGFSLGTEITEQCLKGGVRPKPQAI